MDPIPHPICHHDGTVSYWSPCTQALVPRQTVVPAVALDIQPESVRQRVLRHLMHGPRVDAQRFALRLCRTRARIQRLARYWTGRPGRKGAEARAINRAHRCALRA